MLFLCKNSYFCCVIIINAMKRLTLFVTLLTIVLGLFSCSKDRTYKDFVGTWGVERLEYYNIDYAGNPIPGSLEVYEFPLGDAKDGIDLIFRSDKTGEMRDRSRDTIYNQISVDPVIYDTIINPDTTLVTYFTYSFDEEESTLFMMMDYARTFSMKVSNFEDDSFVYYNEYDENYIEKAFLKRLNTKSLSKGAATKPTFRPRRPKSFMSE